MSAVSTMPDRGQIEQIVRIAGEFGRDIANGKEARRIYRIGEFYGSADETLARNGFGATEFFEEGEARPRSKGDITPRDRVAKNWLVPDQLTTHPPPLRALTAHDETDARLFLPAGGESGADLDGFLAFRKSGQLFTQLTPIARDQRQAMRMMVPAHSESVGEVRDDG